MIKEYKPFTEETLADALKVVGERFAPPAIEMTKRILRNPLRKVCADAGTIGYRDGRPVAFQAAMLRRLYFGRKPILGVVGGMTCKVKKACPLSVLLETIDRAAAPRAGSVMNFGNTCGMETSQMDEAGGGHVGPESCHGYLWKAIRPLKLLAYLLRTKVLKCKCVDEKDYRCEVDFHKRAGEIEIKRLREVSPSFFDVLMAEYLKTNEGLVCSRSAEEIDWIFGDRIRSGKCVVLAAYKASAPIGYIILTTHGGKFWGCGDLFALRNDANITRLMIKTACKFLRCTPAIIFKLRGFSSSIRSTLISILPHFRREPFNAFSWSLYDKSLEQSLLPVIDTSGSWFFGPYDGDSCF